MDQHKKLMEKCLKQLTSSRTSPILSEEKYARVMEVLQNLTVCKDRNFKHWVLKMKQFQIMDLPGLGVKDALVVPIKDTKRIFKWAKHIFSQFDVMCYMCSYK